VHNVHFALILSLVAATGAAAQTPAPLPLPLDLPAAQAAAQLEGAGFRRSTTDNSRSEPLPGGGSRRIAADPSASTYTRVAGDVTESVFMRAGETGPAHLFYSAFGDSAGVHARLATAAADVARRSGDGRLTVPASPSRLADGRYQFTVLFHRPRAAPPVR
jgi:hypothetical protein